MFSKRELVHENILFYRGVDVTQTHPLLRKYPPKRRNGVINSGPSVRAMVTEGDAAEIVYPAKESNQLLYDEGYFRVHGKWKHCYQVMKFKTKRQ